MSNKSIDNDSIPFFCDFCVYCLSPENITIKESSKKVTHSHYDALTHNSMTVTL